MTKQKKSTRKINLQSDDALSIFFKSIPKEQSVNFFAKLKNTYNIELRLNDVGLLVIKCPTEKSSALNSQFLKLNQWKKNLNLTDIENTIEKIFSPNFKEEVEDFQENNSVNSITFRKKNGHYVNVVPKTDNQAKFLEAIFTKPVTLGLGSAGTGKSYLAIAASLKLLFAGRVKKIIISKPPIESGPSIGYLPGSVDEKLSAYAASFMGILAELIGYEEREKLIADKQIQIENIGFLRGMTLGARDGVVYILDEAQNIDFAQHKMILSRLGANPESRIIYAGDQKQSDLRNKKDTLSVIHEIIKDSPYVGSVVFTKKDIVRSETVKDLLGRIEDWEDKETESKLKRGKQDAR